MRMVENMKAVYGGVGLALVALMLVGCGGGGDPRTLSTGPGGDPVVDSIDRVQLRDRVLVTVTGIPEPSAIEQRVREDGTITLPYDQEFHVAGRTLLEIEDEIQERYVPQYFTRMTVTIKLEERYFYVRGQVRARGRHVYSGTMTILKAISAAQGFTDFANEKKVQLQRADGRTETVNCIDARKNPEHDLPLYPGDQIFVPRRYL